MILIPNILTLCNFLCGLSAIIFSLNGRWRAACWLILVSAFLDGMDGWTARTLRKETRFGALFDSLADFVSFGIAPVFIFYTYDKNQSIWIPITITFYMAASGFRLIRFHIQDHTLYFQGLPTTASAFMFATAMLTFSKTPGTETLYMVLMWILSFLMASRIPCPRTIPRGGVYDP